MQDWPLANKKLQLLTSLSTNGLCHFFSLAILPSWFCFPRHLPEFSFSDLLLFATLVFFSHLQACLSSHDSIIGPLLFLSTLSMSNCIYDYDFNSEVNMASPNQLLLPAVDPYVHFLAWNRQLTVTGHSNITGPKLLSLLSLLHSHPRFSLSLSWWITHPCSRNTRTYPSFVLLPYPSRVQTHRTFKFRPQRPLCLFPLSPQNESLCFNPPCFSNSFPSSLLVPHPRPLASAVWTPVGPFYLAFLSITIQLPVHLPYIFANVLTMLPHQLKKHPKYIYIYYTQTSYIIANIVCVLYA